MLFPFYGGGGCKRNHPDLSTTTNAQANRKKGCYWGVARGSLYKSLIYFWHHHVMFEEDWKKKEEMKLYRKGRHLEKQIFRLQVKRPKLHKCSDLLQVFQQTRLWRGLGKNEVTQEGRHLEKQILRQQVKHKLNVCVLTYSWPTPSFSAGGTLLRKEDSQVTDEEWNRWSMKSCVLTCLLVFQKRGP